MITLNRVFPISIAPNIIGPEDAASDYLHFQLFSFILLTLTTLYRLSKLAVLMKLLDPTSTVISFTLKPFLWHLLSKLLYFNLFLSWACSKAVSNAMVSSMMIMDFEVSFQMTRSGLRSVVTMCCGKEYSVSGRSTVSLLQLGRWCLRKRYRSFSTLSCLRLKRR